MKNIDFRIAFLHKNFRDMGFEMKLVFLMHLATVVFCFMPWVSYLPLYGNSYYDNAFDGPTVIIGSLVFIISLIICAIFTAKLLKFKKLPIPVDENIVFLVAGIQQTILIICAWSVLILIGGSFSEIRFGISFCLLFQIFGIVASYLLIRGEKRNDVIDFFHQAEEKIIDKAKDVFKKGNPAKK